MTNVHYDMRKHIDAERVHAAASNRVEGVAGRPVAKPQEQLQAIVLIMGTQGINHAFVLNGLGRLPGIMRPLGCKLLHQHDISSVLKQLSADTALCQQTMPCPLTFIGSACIYMFVSLKAIQAGGDMANLLEHEAKSSACTTVVQYYQFIFKVVGEYATPFGLERELARSR